MRNQFLAFSTEKICIDGDEQACETQILEMHAFWGVKRKNVGAHFLNIANHIDVHFGVKNTQTAFNAKAF